MNSIVQNIRNKTRILLVGGFLLTGLCASEGLRAQDSTAGKTVAQKKFQRLMKKKKTVLLDVRTTEEYKEGHIPGSIQIDVLKPEEFKNQVTAFNKRKTYLLYCRSGKRSNNAKLLMKEMGFSKLYDLKDGFSQWTGQKEMK